MKLSTLILSGASTKIPVYIGIFRALYEKNILNNSLDGISHIVTCSIGMLISIYILLDIPIHVQEEGILKADFTKLLDLDNLDIHNLLSDNGLFNNKVSVFVKGILQHKYNKDDMTLKELYDIKPILLTIKCINVTKGYTEYINKNTDPDLSILTLLLMTTAIPIFFKPIEYNQCLYVDGGLNGGYPIELVKEDYLGFIITENEEKTKYITTGIPFLDFLINLIKVKIINYDNYPSKFNIKYSCNLHFSEFNVSVKEKKELIQFGYDRTIQHIEKYNITNDLFNTLHQKDTVPSEEDLVQE